MKNKIVQACWILTLCLLATFRGHAGETGDKPGTGTRPNVIIVITDDQGYGDLSCHGNPLLKTPELDKLHAESVRLTDFHVSPTCSPTRGALMSGQWTNRAGSWHTVMGRSMMFEDKTTLGQVFADNGYATGMFGKWHLGDNYPHRPEDRGFQEVVRHGGGGVGHTPDYWNNAYFDDTYFHNSEPRRYKGYCTDIFFNEAKRFIKAQADQGKPFFAYISSNAPHGPHHCPENYWKPYLNHEGVDKKLAVFYGMIVNIDENVGALRRWLAEQGLAENTLFIFMTDNGTANGETVYNAGMRGKKGSAYDGGHRVPFFLYWPAGGFDTAQDVDRLTAHVDVIPTLVDLCGLAPLKDYVLDGRSLVPLLKNPQAEWRERVIVTDSQRVIDPVKWKQSSTMTERWRMINGKELYDIEADPGQQNDVAAQYPEVMARLTEAYNNWWEDLSPALARTARIHIGSPKENPTVLTAHDWLTDGAKVPYHHGHIRRTRERPETGRWALSVEQAGTYRIALRRWPRESGLSLRSGVPPGDPVPGLEAFRETEGLALQVVGAGIKIVGQTQTVDIPKDLPEAAFELQLPAGEVYLDAHFTLDSGEQLGAYYAYIEKL